MSRYYNLCCRYRGQNVRITDRYGRVHAGRIARVDNRNVYLQPIGGRNLGGFGWGFYGGFYPAYPIALAAIAGIAIGGLLFW
ncbi:hypothetical protein LC040_02670 [Bacillus tianshenii]|nr:hypothetical protein LC040_02670 [Bacillus tianshenii]